MKQAGSRNIQVVGLSLPNLCKPYVHGGEVEAVVLWKTGDLGYFSVTAPAALVRGTFSKDKNGFSAGRLGLLQVQGSDVILGKPFIFRKDNIDQFNFYTIVPTPRFASEWRIVRLNLFHVDSALGRWEPSPVLHWRKLRRLLQIAQSRDRDNITGSDVWNHIPPPCLNFVISIAVFGLMITILRKSYPYIVYVFAPLHFSPHIELKPT